MTIKMRLLWELYLEALRNNLLYYNWRLLPRPRGFWGWLAAFIFSSFKYSAFHWFIQLAHSGISFGNIVLTFGIRGILKVYPQSIFGFTDGTVYVQIPFENEAKSKEETAESKEETANGEKSREESKGESENNRENRDENGEESKEESKEEIFKLMAENPKISTKDIACAIGLSVAGVEKNIRQLKKAGRVKRDGSTKNGSWVVL